MKNTFSFSSLIQSILKKNRLLSLFLVLSVASSVALSLLPPLVLAGIVNRLTKGDTDFLNAALLYFLLTAAGGILDSGKEILITVFGQKMTHGIRSRMCEKLSRLPAQYYTAHESGDTASRFVNDVDTMEELFTDGVIGMFTDALKVCGIIFMIWIKSRGLGMMITLAAPLLFFLTRAFQKRMLKAQAASRAAVGKVNNHIPETVRNIRMIHAFGKESYMETCYDRYILDQYQATEKSNFYDSVYSPIIIMTSTVVIAVMMVMAASGGEMRSFFGMDAGTAVAVIAYVGRVFTPLEAIGMEIQTIQSAIAGKHRIEEFLNLPERTMPDPALRVTPNGQEKSCMALDDVSFGYDPAKPVLKHFSLSVRQGETVTLAGRTGIGKSTVFRLLLGLYEPQKGSVSVYGVKASSVPDREKRKLFGYVEQSFVMTEGSVADQISLFDPEITMDQIMKAAQLSGIHAKILQFPEGYDTPCRENLFSQGELQLLSIARAVARDPAVLLLDEITASLDAATEKVVMEALRRASENRTVLSISHRLYTDAEARIVSL